LLQKIAKADGIVENEISHYLQNPLVSIANQKVTILIYASERRRISFLITDETGDKRREKKNRLV